MLVILYLTSIIIANLLVAQFGASIVILNAFLFIGLDLTARDRLHEEWKHKNLWLNMFMLISVGSILSAILNWQALPIAMASFVAFGSAGIVDTFVYQLLGNNSRLVKVNGSNVFSSIADSLVFAVVAFGFPVLWWIIAGQIIAKIVGGFVWSLVLVRND